MRKMLVIVIVGACAGDETDEGNTPPCTGALYDTCTNEHECMSNDCRPIGGTEMCTQACSAALPCPAEIDDTPVTCGAGGICEPSKPHVCRVQ